MQKMNCFLQEKDNFEKKQRKSNLELFRIITMLLIIAHHYVVNSGLTDINGPIFENPFSFDSIYLLILGAWGKIGINCFVLFTGYFMINSQISLRKFLKLFFEIMFYRIVIGSIFVITGYQSFDFKIFVELFIPIQSVEQNFTDCYLLFFLFIPFLNILIRNLNEKLHILLLILCSITYIFFGTFHRVSMNYVSWFMVLYVISTYIKLYPKEWMTKLSLNIALLFLTVSLSILSVLLCTWLSIRFQKNNPYFFVTDSNSILAVSTGISAFLLFNNLKIPYNKFINNLASTTFGILLIHANSDSMRQWLWKDIFDNIGHYGKSWHIIYCVIVVFSICSIIDLIRIRLIEKLFFIIWDKIVNGIQKSSYPINTKENFI